MGRTGTGGPPLCVRALFYSSDKTESLGTPASADRWDVYAPQLYELIPKRGRIIKGGR